MLQESKTTEERRKFKVIRVLDDQMDLVGGLTFPLGLYAEVFIAPAKRDF